MPEEPITLDLDHLEDIAKAGTQGQWHWAGNTKNHQLHLATWLPGAGRCLVLTQRRWGRNGARPQFLTKDLMLVDGDELAVYEVARSQGLPDDTPADHPEVYRHDVVDINHPDARHMATFSPQVTQALIKRLRDAELWTQVHPCDVQHEPPFDFDQCATHDRTFARGSTCDHEGLSELDWMDKREREQRVRALHAEERVEQLEAALAAVKELADIWLDPSNPLGQTLAGVLEKAERGRS